MLGVGSITRLDEQVRLADGKRLRVDLLAEQVHVGPRVDPLPPVTLDVLLGNGEHAARAAAGVAHRNHSARFPEPSVIAREQQVYHEANDVAGREVFARVLVQRFIELADQLLEDRSHLGVGNAFGAQVHVLEALDHLVQQLGFLELGDRVVEAEVLDYLQHVGAEARDVIPQVLGEVCVVAE